MPLAALGSAGLAPADPRRPEGRVWRGRLTDGREVAVKLAAHSEQPQGTAAAPDRLALEAQVLAQLRPRGAPVPELIAAEPGILVTQWCAGATLDDWSQCRSPAARRAPVVVVNPRQVQDFARATEQLAETDALDAAILAPFDAAVRPPACPLRDAETQALHALATRQHQVLTRLVAALVSVAPFNRDSGTLWGNAPSGMAARHPLQGCVGRQSFRLTFKTVASL